jgi:hypothetical protein
VQIAKAIALLVVQRSGRLGMINYHISCYLHKRNQQEPMIP